MFGDRTYGTKHGRLTYRTAQEARAVADELGLTSVHSITKNSQTMFRPGDDIDDLNAALQAKGMQPLQTGSGGLMDAGGMQLGGGSGGFF